MQKWGNHALDIAKSLIGWILSLGIAALIGWLAWLKNAPAYLIALISLGAISAILTGINQFLSIREKRSKNFLKHSEKRLEKIIRDWVDIPAFTFQRQEPEDCLFFKFLIKDKNSRSINIIREKDEPDLISIIAEINIEDPPANKEPDFLIKLSSNISLELARLGIQFVFNGEKNKFNRIRIIEQVSLRDPLTGLYFRQRIFFVIRAYVLIVEISKVTYRKQEP